MTEPRRDRWLSIVLSVLVHATIVGMLGWGWWHLRKAPPAPQQLAIEATVVLDRAATRTPAPPSAAAAPAPVEPVPAVATPAPAPVVTPAPAAHAAEPDTAAQERAAQEQRERQEKQEAARADAQHAKEQQAAQRRAAEQREVRKREAAEQERRERELKERAAAEAKRLADAAVAAQDKARRESELHAQLAVEERINAARGSAQAAAYRAMITEKIKRAWIRPPSARPGVSCVVSVTQVPGGEVTGVQIQGCNGDQAVRESIEAAVYRASPLPVPSNPDLFDRNLSITFHPDE